MAELKKLELIERKSACPITTTPVLFVHGAWHGAWCWEHFQEQFAAVGFDSFALSLRSHGGSPGPPMNSNSIKDYLNDLIETVALMPEEPIIIAHSMGGLILQKYLEKFPCRAAILLAPVPTTGVLPITLKYIFKTNYGLLAMLKMNLYDLVNNTDKAHHAFFSENAELEVVRSYQEQMNSESFLAFLGMLYPNVRVKYHRRVPLLVCGAANDQIFSTKEITRTANAYGADLKIFDNTAHDLMLEANHKEIGLYLVDWLTDKLSLK